MYSINFRFCDLKYDGFSFSGEFDDLDGMGKCRFCCGLTGGELAIWDSTFPDDDPPAIPIRWLQNRLAEQGFLRETETRICY